MTERIPAMSRVIVRGGRVVHAVVRGEDGVQRTACGSRRLRAVDRQQHASEPITCPGCKQAAKRKDPR